MRLSRLTLSGAVAAGLLATLLTPAVASAGSPAPRHRGPATAVAQPRDHADAGTSATHRHGDHDATPGHIDSPPPGVDVHARVSPAEQQRRAGLAKHPAKFRHGRLPARAPLVKRGEGAPSLSAAGESSVAASTTAPSTVLSVPAGQPGNPALAEHVAPSCSGDGVDGHRVQVIYVHEQGTTDQLAAYLPALRSYVADVDDTFALSSSDGSRRVRWVTDASCVPDIRSVEVPAGSLTTDPTDDVGALKTIQTAAQNAGIPLAGRKLLAFADANSLCGLAEVYNDPTADTSNANNSDTTMVARVDNGCWDMQGQESTAAHELMHNLGGVNTAAPHGTTRNHCTDEWDVMCYADGGKDKLGQPASMTAVCPTSHTALFDCGNDDYFSVATPPAGSYLASNWNTANSSYLDVVDGGTPVTLPTASVTGPATLRPGLAAYYTVASDVAGAVKWTVPSGAEPCLTAGATSSKVRVQCPSNYYGTLRLTATVTTDAGQTLTAFEDVGLTGPSAALSVALSASSKVYVGSAATLSATVRYGSLPVRSELAAQVRVLVNGSWTWRTFATKTSTTTGAARFYAPKWTSAGARYYRVQVIVGPGSGWTSTTSATRKTYSIVRTSLASSVHSGRPDRVYGQLRTSSGSAVRYQYVTLQYRYYGSSVWHYAKKLRTGSTGKVATSVQPRRRTYYRWVYSGSTTYGSSVSAQRYLRY